jgi:hypothetical protein
MKLRSAHGTDEIGWRSADAACGFEIEQEISASVRQNAMLERLAYGHGAGDVPHTCDPWREARRWPVLDIAEPPAPALGLRERR